MPPDATLDATVEYQRPEGGAMGYLVRPFFPMLELMGEGQVGLGTSPRQSTPQASTLGANLRRAANPRTRYEDGIEIVDAATSARWTPGNGCVLRSPGPPRATLRELSGTLV